MQLNKNVLFLVLGILGVTAGSWADDLDAVRRVGNQVIACEQQLVANQQTLQQNILTYRPHYDSSERCRWLVQESQDAEQPYIEMGNADREAYGNQIDNYPLERIQARLQGCLSAVQSLSDYLGKLDAAGCNVSDGE